jgi:hypothetical protein
MRAMAMVVLVCAFAVSVPPVTAQQSTPAPPPPVSDPQAVALMQRALVALTGGVPVSDATLTGTAQRIAGSDNETGTATAKAMPLGYSLLDLNLSSSTRSEIRNASAVPLPGTLPPDIPATVAQTPQPVGAWSGNDGVLHAMVQHNLVTDATWFFPPFTLGNLMSSSNSVLSYVGQETHNGQPVLHISASQFFSTAPSQAAPLLQHLSQMDLYLNPTTLLPVALDFAVHPDNNAGLDIRVEIQFSNYQPVNEVWVPLHVQKYMNNGLVLDLQFKNVVLNTGLSSTTFNIQ